MDSAKQNNRMRKLISVRQAADRIGYSRVHIVRLIHAGKIPARKVGRNYVIDSDELEYIWIRRPVERVIKEYGEVLKRLGNS
jgi:excisionase family DNA binding protein